MATDANRPVCRHAFDRRRRARTGGAGGGFVLRAARSLLTTGLVVLSAGGDARASAPAPVRRTIADLGGRPVVIEVTVGVVRIDAWSQPGLEVEMTPNDGGEPGSLDLGVDETPDVVRIRAVQPGGARDAGRRATVTVRLPAAATVQRVELFEGRLELDGLRGSVQGKVERGTIVASRLAGVVRLETGSGDIVATAAELTTPGLLRLRTFNGSITLGLVRAPADARVLALTLNGQIRSDLPLAERSGFGPRFREGIFGVGEPLVSLDAVRGDIAIIVGKNPR